MNDSSEDRNLSRFGGKNLFTSKFKAEESMILKGINDKTMLDDTRVLNSNRVNNRHSLNQSHEDD